MTDLICSEGTVDYASVQEDRSQNTVLLAGINETAAWKNHFWGYVCICASVYERERERGELLKYFGEAGHVFYETLKGTIE